MHRSTKQYLLLSSIFILSGCAISKYKHLSCEESRTIIEPVIGLNPRYKHLADSGGTVILAAPKGALKYKASIDVLKNHLTGLLIVKQTDSITKHMVFVTELGMKMFDFEAKNNELKAVYVFEALNKPLLIDALTHNFSNMFFLNTEGRTFNECSNKKQRRLIKFKQGKDTWFYSNNDQDDSNDLFPRLQETFHKRKRTSKIEYLVDKQPSFWYYSKITSKQYGLVKFYFELNAISLPNE